MFGVEELQKLKAAKLILLSAKEHSGGGYKIFIVALLMYLVYLVPHVLVSHYLQD
jgi:hypothetical protein